MMNLCKVCMHTLINEFSFNKLDELKLKLFGLNREMPELNLHLKHSKHC